MKQKIGVLCAVREDSVIRRLARELDDGERCTFRIVRTGTDALLEAQRYAPDILVVDSVLTGMDGIGVVERMKTQLGGRMPRVIGGVMMPLAEEGFRRRGVRRTVQVPWEYTELRIALEDAMEEIDTFVDWQRAQEGYEHACVLLARMGMRPALHGFTYLAWAAALAARNESRVHAIGMRLYAPIAARFGTTPQNVERLIRHAVESTMDDAKAKGIYSFFGNTIDPTRGKPTNAQIVSMLAQKVRMRR